MDWMATGGGVAPPLPLPPPAHVLMPVGSTLHCPEQQSELTPQPLPKGKQLTVVGGGVVLEIAGGMDRTAAGGVAPPLPLPLSAHVPMSGVSKLHSLEQQSELALQPLPAGWQLTVAGGGVEVSCFGGEVVTASGGDWTGGGLQCKRGVEGEAGGRHDIAAVRGARTAQRLSDKLR